jgi:phosphoserine phosphatase RsbX
MSVPNETESLVDWGVATRALAGQTVSGDLHVVQPFRGGVLVAVADGLGHGQEAAVAAQAAVATLTAHADASVLVLLKRCHENLHKTRGVALTLASFSARDGTITWLGVGNVDGVLLRADPKTKPARDYALLHGGVVGLQLPPLRAFILPVVPGDTLILATDGVRAGFAEGLPLNNSPQQIADHILVRDGKDTDDALVLVARYREARHDR